MATLEDILDIDLRVGTIVAARALRGARHPALALTLDFGALGQRAAAYAAAGREEPDALVGLQVVAVMNLPPRELAGFESQVLVLGVRDARGEAVLLLPERPVGDGTAVTWPEEP